MFGLEIECNMLIARAKNEIESGNIKKLEKMESELQELGKKLDAVVGTALGFIEANEPKKESGDVKYKKSDTKPFEISKK